jgi:hypothetical protein
MRSHTINPQHRNMNKSSSSLSPQSKKIVEAMRQTRGKFFGVRLKNGENLSAKFVKETPKYVVLHDFNSPEYQGGLYSGKRKVAKSSLVDSTLL